MHPRQEPRRTSVQIACDSLHHFFLYRRKLHHKVLVLSICEYLTESIGTSHRIKKSNGIGATLICAHPRTPSSGNTLCMYAHTSLEKDHWAHRTLTYTSSHLCHHLYNIHTVKETDTEMLNRGIYRLDSKWVAEQSGKGQSVPRTSPCWALEGEETMGPTDPPEKRRRKHVLDRTRRSCHV